MNDHEKIDLLFDTIDTDKCGQVDALELSMIMRRNNKKSVSDSLDKAIDMVAKFDKDGDGELDRDEFHAFVTTKMAPTLKMSVVDLCESLFVQLIRKDTSKDGQQDDDNKLDKGKLREKVKKRGEVLAFLDEKGMSHSFVLHDSFVLEDL